MQELTRRNFLGWTAAGVLWMLVPAIATPRVSTFALGCGFRKPIRWRVVYRESGEYGPYHRVGTIHDDDQPGAFRAVFDRVDY